MTNIKISTNEKEIMGVVETSVVKSFGDSAHVILSKKHLGKNIFIVIPEESEYSWMLKDKDLKEVLNASHTLLKSDKTPQYIQNLSKDKFKQDDIIKVIDFLKTSDKYDRLIQKLEQTYNIEPSEKIRIKELNN